MNEVKLARNITTKFFGDGKALYKEMVKAGEQVRWLGTIVGAIYQGKEQFNEVAGADAPVRSIKLFGEFQAVRNDTGEVIDSNAAFLPMYFAEAAQAALESGGRQEIEFAIDVGIEQTDRGIPYAWCVRNRIQRTAESPVERMKRALIAQGGLGKLPAPVKLAIAAPAAPTPEETAETDADMAAEAAKVVASRKAKAA